MEQTQLIEYFDKSEKNQQLLKLFESKGSVIEKIYNEFQNAVKEDEEDWIVMHLSCIPYNYEKMKYKILIVGQENNGWGDKTKPRDSMLFTLIFHSERSWDNRFFHFPYNFCQSI